MTMFKRYKLNDVFTPTTTAQLNYVVRDKLEKTVESNILLPGKQVVIYGHSGGGKTTITLHILKKLRRPYIITHCESATTLNDILLSAFDALNKFYISQYKQSSTASIGAGIRTEFNSIAGQINAQRVENEEQTKVRLLPPQLTPQKLAQFLGEVKAVWIIEDFHKVDIAEKRRIADILKIFVDSANRYPEVKIICIGAVDTARELVELDDNLNTRIAELHVPLLEDAEIKGLVQKGCECLNISMSDSLIEKIVYYSNNLASLAHQMCYDICQSNGIDRKRIKKKSIDDSCFKDAVELYITSNSDTLKRIYDSIVKNQIAWYILKTFATKDKPLSFNEIKGGVCANSRSYADDTIQAKLDELAQPAMNVIRYDSNSGKYSIATPFWGAFLKMQLALENAKTKKARKNKHNLNLIIKNQTDIDSAVYDVFLHQLELLRTSYQHRDQE